MQFIFGLMYFINRYKALYLVKVDLDFLNSYYGKELSNEEGYRERLAKLQEKEKFNTKKKLEKQNEQIRKEIIELNGKISELNKVRQRIDEMNRVREELKYFKKLLWKRLWGKNL